MYVEYPDTNPNHPVGYLFRCDPHNWQNPIRNFASPPLYCGGQADHYHLEQVPLERYFPEYTGGFDIHKTAKYILWRFMQANRARLSLYPQYVTSPFIVLLSPLTLWLVWRERQIKRISDWYSLSSKRQHCKMRSRTHGSDDLWASQVVTSVFLDSLSFLPSFLCLSSLSFAWWVPLFHRYFSFPYFRLLVSCSAWRFWGRWCRSFNCSLRSVIDFLRSLMEWPYTVNILTPPPDSSFFLHVLSRRFY